MRLPCRTLHLSYLTGNHAHQNAFLPRPNSGGHCYGAVFASGADAYRSCSDSVRRACARRRRRPTSEGRAGVRPRYPGKIVAQNPNVARDADRDGFGIIVRVIQDGRLDGGHTQDDMNATVGWLLDHGADPNLCPQGRQRTPLTLAIDQSGLALVKLLLAKGADPNLADSAGSTPFDQVMFYGSRYRSLDGTTTAAGLLAALLDKSNKIPFNVNRDGKSAILLALTVILSPLGSTENLQTLIAAGADFHSRTGAVPISMWGMFPIVMSSQPNRVSTLRDVNLRDLGAVDFAVLGGNKEVLKYLLSKGLSVSGRTLNGDTPLHFAAFARPSMIPALLALHADPGALNNQGQTPLAFALSNPSIEDDKDFPGAINGRSG